MKEWKVLGLGLEKAGKVVGREKEVGGGRRVVKLGHSPGNDIPLICTDCLPPLCCSEICAG